jgi:hypothetical protein
LALASQLDLAGEARVLDTKVLGLRSITLMMWSLFGHRDVA